MAKGRDKNLIELRDEALCRRYYYWTEVQRLRFDDALKVLSRQEFFISEERIMSIIRRKCRELKDLEVKPVPQVKKPRLTATQLSLFTGECTFPLLHGRLVMQREGINRLVHLDVSRQRIVPALYPDQRAGLFRALELL